MKTLLAPAIAIGKLFYNGRVLRDKTGAEFAKARDYKTYLSPRNKGLLIDGKSLRLSEEASFQNVAVYGVTGKGKSSAFVRPIIFDKSDSNSVLIVNDMKGDIYRDTSGRMARKGYRIIVLNPHDLAHSNRFNPFLELKNENETVFMAKLFVEAVSSSKDPIWTAGAERFVTFFLKCLMKKGKRYNTPHNLYYLFQSFGEDGSNLHRFVAECSYDDPFMVNEWKSLLSVHQDGILSFIMNATTALKIFANKDACTLTATSDIDLSTLRRQKTIIYVITPPQYAKMYRPLTSMFFMSFLLAGMRRIPDSRNKDLPIYFLWDEFGNSFLPDFHQLITTVRQYKISLMLFMQGISQLVVNYGRDNCNTIMSGIATQISFGVAGNIRVNQRPQLNQPHLEQHQEYPLIEAAEVRSLPENTLLIISDNRKPTKIQSTPSYQHPRFSKFMKYPPAPIQSAGSNEIEFLPLHNQ
jgi:type IV secretory pathway TraG/TraD family ATPase VirD4